MVQYLLVVGFALKKAHLRLNGGVTEVEILRIILTVIFAIDCIALAAVILLQEGKQQGLGAIAGVADTYWGKNKGRSMEGGLVKATTVMAVLFFVLAAVLNMNF